MTIRRVAIGAFLSLVSPTLSAHALSYYYSYDDSATIYVGKVNHGGTTSQWLCDDGPSPSDAVWRNLGNSDGLTADWEVHADNNATPDAGGNDTIVVIRSNRTITGDCAATSGQWQAMLYNGYWLDIDGDAGTDNVHGGSGANCDTYVLGGIGNDYVSTYCAAGRADGEAGADNVFGFSGNGDDLYGGTGDDCLQDDNNNWDTYNCGDGNDDWTETNTSAGKMSCENEVQCCFC